MAVLPDATRKRIWARLMAAVSEAREPVALTKTELRAAVEAVDGWVDDNAAAYNVALPTAARTGLTANQKARLLLAVAAARFEVT